MDFRLEICVDSVESAVNAQTGGADRVELCGGLAEGGTTPSYGMILSVRNNLSIDLNVIIRPRGGDFLYSDTEYDIMRRDIELCGECGVNGIVIGILLSDGEIDTERTAKLVELSNPMTVTFHRAFDMCSDPFRGLQDIISAGATRLLTSGHRNKAAEGAELIDKLVKKAGSRIIVMPGSGLNESNIAEVARITGASEFHLSVRNITESEMIFRREGMTIGGVPDIPEFSRKIADPDRIKNIINILKMI
ncbi:MAG: copper homeostasis protein CutC [Bacteroidetes bacterium RBG_13_43_22]|nr:MAG: copper homeostasis protein CutC [Bacteroidetes bacterium RBG_13_43_22]